MKFRKTLVTVLLGIVSIASWSCNLNPIEISEDEAPLVGFQNNSDLAISERLDMLWVVDNSGTMSEEQRMLGENFRDFIEQLAKTNIDFHIGITTTESNYGKQYSNNNNEAENRQFYNGELRRFPTPMPFLDTGALSSSDKDKKNKERTNLTDKTLSIFGQNGSIIPCLKEGNKAKYQSYTEASIRQAIDTQFDDTTSQKRNFLDLFPKYTEYETRLKKPYLAREDYLVNGQLNKEKLIRDFGCIVQAGTFGNGVEKGIQAALEALYPDVNKPVNKVNAGFVRANAKFAVVFVSDENDCSMQGIRFNSLPEEDKQWYKNKYPEITNYKPTKPDPKTPPQDPWENVSLVVIDASCGEARVCDFFTSAGIPEALNPLIPTDRAASTLKSFLEDLKKTASGGKVVKVNSDDIYVAVIAGADFIPSYNTDKFKGDPEFSLDFNHLGANHNLKYSEIKDPADKEKYRTRVRQLIQPFSSHVTVSAIDSSTSPGDAICKGLPYDPLKKRPNEKNGYQGIYCHGSRSGDSYSGSRYYDFASHFKNHYPNRPETGKLSGTLCSGDFSSALKVIASLFKENSSECINKKLSGCPDNAQDGITPCGVPGDEGVCKSFPKQPGETTATFYCSNTFSLSASSTSESDLKNSTYCKEDPVGQSTNDSSVYSCVIDESKYTLKQCPNDVAGFSFKFVNKTEAEEKLSGANLTVDYSAHIQEDESENN